jgi:metal-dependent amidase/aminoacylase/carboxypeptidase family protein
MHTKGEDYSDMYTNQPLSAAYAANLERLGRKLADITSVPAAVAGSTDMGNISKLVPSIHPMIAVSPPMVPLHSAEFAQWAGSQDGRQAVVDGAKALAMTALDVLRKPQLLAEVRAAYAAQQQGAAASLDR